MTHQRYFRSLWLGVCLALAGCGSTPLEQESWPEDIPPREWFLTRYLTDEDNRGQQRHQEYLRWVTRFYYGWLAHPKGWNRATASVVASVDAAAEPEVSRRMMLLGRRIAGEWAKASNARVIDDRAMATWLKVLPLAAEAGTAGPLLVQVAADVDALFAGELGLADITVSRYLDGQEDIGVFTR